MTVTLPKTAAGFGFVITGRKKPGELLQICHIEKGGIAEKDGRLMVGDALVRVDETFVQSYSHQKLVKLFKKLKFGSDVNIEVCRGYPLPESLGDLVSKSTSFENSSGKFDLSLSLVLIYNCTLILGTDRTICKDCFYRYHINPNMPPCHHTHNRVVVEWNDKEERYETTACRPFPTTLPKGVKQGIAMCDPYKGTCRREKCTFAHGRVEQKAWISVLRLQREERGKFNALMLGHTLRLLIVQLAIISEP